MYVVSRGRRTWNYQDPKDLIRDLQSGHIDGADKVLIPDATHPIPLSDHPQFRHQIIDDEVMTEEEPEFQVDLTPMIDVTFLLLIFFMATTMIVMFKTLKAPASKDNKEGSSTRKLPTRSEVEAKFLFVKLSEDGSVEIGGQKVIGLDSVRQSLEKIMALENKRTIVIEAIGKVRHGDVVQVLDAANLAQADKILFAKKVQSK